jgi:hypothetical protein
VASRRLPGTVDRIRGSFHLGADWISRSRGLVAAFGLCLDRTHPRIGKTRKRVRWATDESSAGALSAHLRLAPGSVRGRWSVHRLGVVSVPALMGALRQRSPRAGSGAFRARTPGPHGPPRYGLKVRPFSDGTGGRLAAQDANLKIHRQGSRRAILMPTSPLRRTSRARGARSGSLPRRALRSR